MSQPSVIVFADDPIVKDGADAYLSNSREVRLATIEMQPVADVLLVIATHVTEGTMAWIRSAAMASRNPHMRMVLVVNEISEMQLIRTIEYGLAGLLLRPGICYGQIVQAITASRNDTILPDSAMRSVADYIKRSHSGAPSSHGLSNRDIEVLKMVADGIGTAEIAEHMKYSERTIKNILNSMMKRLDLRNRAHVVSYAMRAGLL